MQFNWSHQGNSYSVVLFSWENSCNQCEISRLVSHLVELLLCIKTQVPNLLPCYNLQYQQTKVKLTTKISSFFLFSLKLSNSRALGCIWLILLNLPNSKNCRLGWKRRKESKQKQILKTAHFSGVAQMTTYKSRGFLSPNMRGSLRKILLKGAEGPEGLRNLPSPPFSDL